MPQVANTRGVTFHGKGILSETELAAAPEEERGKFTSLGRSMVENNIAWVDILKIDVEGAEWTVFMEYFDAGAQLLTLFFGRHGTYTWYSSSFHDDPVH